MGKSCSQSQTFINDAPKIRNEAPRAVKDCTSLHQAKNQTKNLHKNITNLNSVKIVIFSFTEVYAYEK